MNQYHVVVSDSGAFSVWPSDAAVPSGWSPTGITGSHEKCLDAIAAKTSDPMPCPSGAEAPETLISRIRQQAWKQPDKPAVQCDGIVITYGQIFTRAGYVAAILENHRISPGQTVGVYLDRSLALPVAMLGVMAAGGAYVPLDPRYPRDRLRHIIDDSSVTHVLTSTDLLPDLPGNARPILIDDEGRLPDPPHVASGTTESGNSPAYVIYTSGSTGLPRGVVVEHDQVIQLLDAALPWFGITSEDVWSVVHSCAFDFSVWELWGALTSGGRAVLVPADVAQSPADLWDLLRREKVTILSQTPSAFAPLAAAAAAARSARNTRPLRFIVFGGEILGWQHLEEWVATFGLDSPALVNMYGITETTVHVTAHRVTAADADRESLPIGEPLPHLRLHVLSRHGRPVPPGSTGELCLAGGGLSRGYLGQPALTAARFVPDPFGPASSRLYRSGDIARVRTDGLIEIVGRKDNQVQVRGFRVELGEIENALRRVETIRDAAVVYVERPGSKSSRLVACVVAKDELDRDAVRTGLRRTLPEWMIPAEFVLVPALPTDANGKLDRDALRSAAAKPARAASEAIPDGPRFRVLDLVLSLWQDILKIDDVGPDDDFFALGGHSLDAVAVQLAVERVVGVRVQLGGWLANPTPRALADLAATGTHIERSLSPSDGASPLSAGQRRLWFLEQLDPGTHAYNTTTTFIVEGDINLRALRQAADDLCSRHDVFRTRYRLVGERLIQDVVPEFQTAVFEVDPVDPSLDSATEDDLLAHAAEETRRLFDLECGPLVRFRVRPGRGVSLLYISMHHSIEDEWSLGIVFRELSECYRARLRGVAPALPPLPIQYADYARWQERWLVSPAASVQRDYWLRQLGSAPQRLPLSAGRRRTAEPQGVGAVHRFVVEPELSARVRMLAAGMRVSVYTVLLAAFTAMLRDMTGAEDIVVGAPMAGRNHEHLDRLVGFFINTTALRIDLSGDPEFAELVRRVRRTLLGAVVNQDYPFDEVVRGLAPSRGRGWPLVQVMFNMHSMPTHRLSLGEAAVVRLPVADDTARTEIAVYIEDTAHGMAGKLIWDVGLFDETTPQRLTGAFVAKLDEATMVGV